MSRLDDIRETMKRDIPSTVLAAHARADIPYLLDLVERATYYVEAYADALPDAQEARGWLSDARGEERP